MTVAKKVEYAIGKAWDLLVGDEEGGEVLYGIDKDTYVRLEREGARRTLTLYYKGKGIARYEGEEVFTSLVIDTAGCGGKAAARRLFGFGNFRLFRSYWVADKYDGGYYRVIDDWNGETLPPLSPQGALRLYVDTRTAVRIK